ncbi:MAG: type II toxin-antitoxin system HigB family toxin [Tepidisphaeraceae bacterium]|jgi:mRNA interferase HigB
MRIVKTSTLRAYWRKHPEAEASLRTWIAITRAGVWSNLADLRRSIPSADLMVVASGRPVVVFNIAANRYRLIAAVHFNRRIVYTLRILTHKEYDRSAWKERL